MQAVSVDKQFYTLGFLAQMFQRTPADLRVILAASGVKPTHSVNDLVYFDGYAIIAIGRALKGADGDE